MYAQFVVSLDKFTYYHRVSCALYITHVIHDNHYHVKRVLYIEHWTFYQFYMVLAFAHEIRGLSEYTIL